MRPHAGLVLILFALATFGAPLALAVGGVAKARGRSPYTAQPSWDWRLTLASTLTYVLAFNLVFITQELFLVLPKALTPGLHPVLYHNDHRWTGADPVARLYQGTGALAILCIGLAAAAWVNLRPPRSPAVRLFIIWVAFSGLFQSLPQVVAGAALPGNDVGMALDYLGATLPAMWVAAGAAVVAMAAAGLTLTEPLLQLGDAPEGRANGSVRAWIAFQMATLPAVLGIPLILPFRIPGAIDQVLIVPVAVTVLGVVWVQAWSWWVADVRVSTLLHRPAIARPFLACLVLLLFFQVILRPGIAF